MCSLHAEDDNISILKTKEGFCLLWSAGWNTVSGDQRTERYGRIRSILSPLLILYLALNIKYNIKATARYTLKAKNHPMWYCLVSSFLNMDDYFIRG